MSLLLRDEKLHLKLEWRKTEEKHTVDFPEDAQNDAQT
jgi:hypothetical protein